MTTDALPHPASGIVYVITLADGRTLHLPDAPVAASAAPDWSRLSFHQCGNCPLDACAVAYCPLALRLAGVVTQAGALCSHDEVDVTVTNPERAIVKRTTAQRAIGSLLGMMMATSGCPRTRFLSPMAAFHLPFSTERETVYRVTSMYLLAQYLKSRRGEAPDWALGGLREQYAQLQHVNAGIASRLRAAAERDAAVNGVILLDLLAKAVPALIDEDLPEVAELFS